MVGHLREGKTPACQGLVCWLRLRIARPTSRGRAEHWSGGWRPTYPERVHNGYHVDCWRSKHWGGNPWLDPRPNPECLMPAEEGPEEEEVRNPGGGFTLCLGFSSRCNNFSGPGRPKLSLELTEKGLSSSPVSPLRRLMRSKMDFCSSEISGSKFSSSSVNSISLPFITSLVFNRISAPPFNFL